MSDGFFLLTLLDMNVATVDQRALKVLIIPVLTCLDSASDGCKKGYNGIYDS